MLYEADFEDQDYDVFEENIIPLVEMDLSVRYVPVKKVLKGSNCEYISVCDIGEDSQCSDGNSL